MMKDNSTPNEISISFENCCVASGKRWFFANEFNALCCMDNTDDIVFVGMAPGENDSSIYLFADIKYFDNHIYLIPRGASALIVYDIANDSFKRYEIDATVLKSNNPYVEYLKFSVGIIYENKLYMIPRTYPAIVVFDIANETLNYETSWLKLINDHIFEGEAFFWADYSISNNELVLASSNSDCIVRRSFITNEYSIQRVSNESMGYSGIEIVDDRLFLCRRKDGQILYIDKNGGEKRLRMPEGFGVRRIIGFSKLLRLGDYLYAVPMWANYFIRIKLDDCQVDVVKDYDCERCGNEEVATCCAWIEGNNICIDNNLCHTLEEYSEEMSVKTSKLVIGERFLVARKKCMFERESVQENRDCTLSDFIDYINEWNC